MGPWSNKQWALFCAALSHGLGNLSAGSKPPRAETVVKTAEAFEDYLGSAMDSSSTTTE